MNWIFRKPFDFECFSYFYFQEIPTNHPEKVYVAGSGTKNRYKTMIPSKSWSSFFK